MLHHSLYILIFLLISAIVSLVLPQTTLEKSNNYGRLTAILDYLHYNPRELLRKRALTIVHQETSSSNNFYPERLLQRLRDTFDPIAQWPRSSFSLQLENIPTTPSSHYSALTSYVPSIGNQHLPEFTIPHDEALNTIDIPIDNINLLFDLG